MTTLSNLIRRHQQHIPLLAALFIAAPILFFQAFRYSFPLGYAGMFTMIAKDISDANFILPMNVLHYGPGGIPLVYPPLAMYVFAVAIKLGVSTWSYLRLVPALFTLLAMIPLYYLTVQLIGSRIAGFLAVILIITQQAVYYTHVWSAGIVRGLALFFCFFGLFFYLRCLRDFSWRYFVLAGLFVGLLLMTHWLYVMFAALFGFACLIAEWKPSRLWTALGIMATALLVAAPWLIVILTRHGANSILAAYSSHRNVDFLYLLSDISEASKFISDNLSYVFDNWFLSALAISGFVLLIIRRKFHILLALLFILMMGEASFYVQILAGMLAAACGAEILRHAVSPVDLRNAGASGLLKLSLALVVIASIVLSSGTGVLRIAEYEPEINENSLRVASFVRTNSDPDATYLFVGKMNNEAEWLPYLLDRTPVLGSWGSEWKGTYVEQSNISFALGSCVEQKDWDCIDQLQQEYFASPILIIVHNNCWSTRPIRDTEQWERIYVDDLYRVWQRIDSSSP